MLANAFAIYDFYECFFLSLTFRGEVGWMRLLLFFVFRELFLCKFFLLTKKDEFYVDCCLS